MKITGLFHGRNFNALCQLLAMKPLSDKITVSCQKSCLSYIIIESHKQQTDIKFQKTEPETPVVIRFQNLVRDFCCVCCIIEMSIFKCFFTVFSSHLFISLTLVAENQ